MKNLYKSFRLITKLALAGIGAFCLLTPAPVQASPKTSIIAQSVGCPRATEVHYAETENFYVFICQAGDGSFFYRGVEKGNTENSVNVSNLEFTDSGSYLARNGNVVYEINPSQLVVYQNGQVILSEGVIRSNF